jgi:hypothetical protein
MMYGTPVCDLRHGVAELLPGSQTGNERMRFKKTLTRHG